MKNLILSFMLLIFIGCEKEKPPAGHYLGYFKYQNFQGIDVTTVHAIEITESSKNSLLINGSVIEKDNHHLKGDTYINGLGTSVYLDGKWEKAFLTNNYRIEGEFVATYTSHGGSFNKEGTFTIKSD